jgi:hypothetical protein
MGFTISKNRWRRAISRRIDDSLTTKHTKVAKKKPKTFVFFVVKGFADAHPSA